MRLLIAICVHFDCHMWATTIATHGPVLCLFTAMHVPLDCHFLPVDCHTWASCLPHRCLLSATCGPHVGQTTATPVGLTWASVAKRVWPTCVPYVGVISTATCGPCVAHLWNVCWVSALLPNASDWPSCSRAAPRPIWLASHRTVISFA